MQACVSTELCGSIFRGRGPLHLSQHRCVCACVRRCRTAESLASDLKPGLASHQTRLRRAERPHTTWQMTHFLFLLPDPSLLFSFYPSVSVCDNLWLEGLAKCGEGNWIYGSDPSDDGRWRTFRCMSAPHWMAALSLFLSLSLHVRVCVIEREHLWQPLQVFVCLLTRACVYFRHCLLWLSPAVNLSNSQSEQKSGEQRETAEGTGRGRSSSFCSSPWHVSLPCPEGIRPAPPPPHPTPALWRISRWPHSHTELQPLPWDCPGGNQCLTSGWSSLYDYSEFSSQHSLCQNQCRFKLTVSCVVTLFWWSQRQESTESLLWERNNNGTNDLFRGSTSSHRALEMVTFLSDLRWSLASDDTRCFSPAVCWLIWQSHGWPGVSRWPMKDQGHSHQTLKTSWYQLYRRASVFSHLLPGKAHPSYFTFCLYDAFSVCYWCQMVRLKWHKYCSDRF